MTPSEKRVTSCGPGFVSRPDSDVNIRGLSEKLILFLLLLTGFSLRGNAQSPTIGNTIPVPSGYLRDTYPPDSYSHWIQNLQLKTQPVILDYRGQTVRSGLYRVWAVVRMPLLFQSDLEQCADFAMRFWAEYHRAAGKLSRLYLLDYGGRMKSFAQSGKSFSQFLKWAFANTNSHSLKSGCGQVAAGELMAGDMFIQNERGGVGHVSVVMDVCKSRAGATRLLVGYSFMPAQEFHIEKADDPYGIEGWFSPEGYTQYLKDHLNFGAPVLRRFIP